MDPAVIGALLAQLTGGQQQQQVQQVQMPPPQQQQVQQHLPSPNFGAFLNGSNAVSTEALLALFSQQANTAAALAALQSGSGAAVPR